MTRTRVALVAPVLALSALLAGCGDDSSSAPEDATQEEFCDAIVNAPEGLDDDDPDAAADAAHDYAEELRGIGTPEDIDDEARRGFEVYVDFLADVDADRIAELQDSGAAFEDVFEGDDLDAFKAFAEVTADCGPGEVETE